MTAHRKPDPDPPPSPSRRRRGTGSVWERSDGKWGWATAQHQGERTSSTVDTRREAEEALAAATAALERTGASPRDLNVTVAAYLDYWLENAVEPVQSANGIANYRQMVEQHIKPTLGRKRLRELSREDVNRLIRIVERKTSKRSGEPLAPKTVRNVHGVLSAALSQAVEWGRVPENVATKPKLPRPRRSEIHPLDEAEARRFLEVSASNRYSLAFSIAVVMGCRKSEILSLEWRDFDLERGRMQVRGTKTAGSHRNLRLPADLVEAVAAFRPVWESWEKPDGEGRLFLNTVGKPIHPRYFFSIYKGLLEEADLRPIRFHDLRHSCATLRILRGEPIHAVAELLGHSSPALVIVLYGHVLETMREQAAERMTGFLPAPDSTALDLQ